MLPCQLMHFVFSKALRRRLRRSGVSVPLNFPSTLQMQAPVAVSTSGCIGSSGRDEVSFPWCFRSISRKERKRTQIQIV